MKTCNYCRRNTGEAGYGKRVHLIYTNEDLDKNGIFLMHNDSIVLHILRLVTHSVIACTPLSLSELNMKEMHVY